MIIIIDLTLKEPQRVENEVHANITSSCSHHVYYVMSYQICTILSR